MMIRVIFFFLLASLSSCFLFSDFSKTRMSYSDAPAFDVIIPKKAEKSELITDSSGNEVKMFYYDNGTVLYFAKMKDTSVAYQDINYDMNIPGTLYNSVYYKGVDSNGRYWRETRFGNYKAGYYLVHEERDGVFDSSLNYFRLRSITNQ